jgi:hypothetical protein
MGTAIRRGSRDNPKYYVEYRQTDGTQQDQRRKPTAN